MTDFYRVCPLHRDELREDGDGLHCPQGHNVDEWLVVSGEGDVVSKAFVERVKVYVGKEATEKVRSLRSHRKFDM